LVCNSNGQAYWVEHHPGCDNHHQLEWWVLVAGCFLSGHNHRGGMQFMGFHWTATKKCIGKYTKFTHASSCTSRTLFQALDGETVEEEK